MASPYLKKTGMNRIHPKVFYTHFTIMFRCAPEEALFIFADRSGASLDDNSGFTELYSRGRKFTALKWFTQESLSANPS